MQSSLLAVALAAATALVLAPACRGSSEAERRASERATAIAEERAQETSLTSATIERSDDARDADVRQQEARANDEIVAAFRLEQADFRGRLRRALDALDKTIAQVGHAPARRADGGTRDLRARRELLKADLAALDRSTEQDWATIRTKVDRDLHTGPH